MTKQIIVLLLSNTFTGIALSLFIKYTTVLINQNKQQQQLIDYLCNKVCQLEKSLNELQQNVEEMEDNIVHRDNTLIESNTELNYKLDKFIQHNFEILE